MSIRDAKVIGVSACLLGERCKYSGGSNRNERVLRFCGGKRVIPVCPEVMGGLPTPRIPSEIAGGTVMNRAGENVDDAFRRGARDALDELLKGGAELVILQPRSPSCGLRQIYDGSFSGRLIPGAGVFAALALDAGLRCLEPEDLPDL